MNDYIYTKDGDRRFHYKRTRQLDDNEQCAKDLLNKLGKEGFLNIISERRFIHDGTRFCEYCKSHAPFIEDIV